MIRSAYLHSVGTYLESTVAPAVNFKPRAAAVALPVDVHAQSILPDRPVASRALLMFGVRITVFVLSCGVFAPYVTTMWPSAGSIVMVLTYLVGLNAATHSADAPATPAMSFDWNASDTETLADPARFRPSVTFERMV